MRHIRGDPLSDQLYAKSPTKGKSITLAQHSEAVLQAARCLFGHDVPTTLGKSWLTFFGVPHEQFIPFITNLRLAAILHDIGKANDGFQQAIKLHGNQVIRHEHLSALIMWLPEMRQWLANCPSSIFEIVLGSVMCHHLKVDDSVHFLNSLVPADDFTVYCGADAFKEILALAELTLQTKAPDLSCYQGRWSFAAIDRKGLHEHLYRSKRLLRNRETHRLYLAVKAALIAADAAGSALIREEIDPGNWIESVMQKPALTSQEIETLIIAPRIRQLEQISGNPFIEREFQTAAGRLGPRALLLAGCGSGKTLAAWKWIQHQAATHRFSRALFLYPTRATATEGFRDYVSWAGDEEAALLHGTSEYDLIGMFTNPLDERGGQDYTAEEGLYTLGYWPKRVFSATVDSFLAFMRHGYTSLCLLPLLTDSAVVIDEVHSFDRSMFTALERFLTVFESVPVLCMTASLTNDRQKTLTEHCGLEVFPRDPVEFKDLHRQMSSPRYIVQRVNEETTSDIIRGGLEKGKKVLWVLNTVNRCQKMITKLSGFCKDIGIPCTCYHSRFRLMDRKKRHGEIINLFRGHIGAALAVTTQVCEMSLDLDADMLVTEMAPVPSLIQRMGRCCREADPKGRRGEVIVCLPFDEKPYTRDEINQCADFVKWIVAKGEVSQDDLSRYLIDQFEVSKPYIEDGFTGFIDSGWYAMGTEETFREGIDFTVECILDTDIDEFNNLYRKREVIDGLVVPVPKRWASREQIIGNRFPIAPSRNYNPLIGFFEQEVLDA